MQVAKLVLLQTLQPVRHGRQVPALPLTVLSTDPARQSLQVGGVLATTVQLPQLSPQAFPPLPTEPSLTAGGWQVPLLRLYPAGHDVQKES